MKELIELYKLSAIQRAKKSADGSGFRFSSNNKSIRLLQGIDLGLIVDDKSACKYLYDNEVMSSSTTYNSLKMRVFNRLKSQFLLIDEQVNFKSKHKKAEFSCIRNAALINMLLMKSADDTALYVAKKYFKVAADNQCSYEASVFAEIIATDEAFRGHARAYERFTAIAMHWREQFLAEKRSRSYFERVMSWYSSHWTLRSEDVPIIEKYLLEIDQLLRTFTSDAITIDRFRLKRVKAEIQKDYSKIVELVDDVENYYNSSKIFTSRHILGAFNSSALAANIWLGDFEKAKIVAERCSKLLDVGTTNWLTYKEYELILSFRLEDHKAALEIYNLVAKHVSRFSPKSLILQKWSLFEFYVRGITLRVPRYSLIPSTILSGASPANRFREFRNSFSTLSRDAGGYAILCNFAQVLFLLQNAEFSALIARDESLQTYRRKRLNPLNYRLNQFARMIHVMVQCDFDYEKTQKKAERYLQNLTDTPAQYRSASAETMEFVPLPALWAVMMRELQRVQDQL